MILWIKKGTMPAHVICTHIPRCHDHLSLILREKVKKSHVHGCNSRCFRTTSGMVLSKCKYGIPFEMREEDGVAKDCVYYE